MFQRRYSTRAAAALQDVLVLSATRTPVGSFHGVLAGVPATRLASTAIAAAVQRSGLRPEQISEAVIGNVLSANLGQAPARQAALGAGMKAVMFGAQSIALGLQTAVVAGGMESMSNAPYYLAALRSGAVYGHQSALDAIVRDGLTCSTHGVHMGECGEETAAAHGITRAEQDAYAVQSYERAARAASSGKFAAEMVSVAVEKRGGGSAVVVGEDEEYRKVDFSKMTRLKPAFRDAGTITAANASTLSDGASAIVLAHVRAVTGAAKPLARILAMADAEGEPKLFATAPSLAIPKALAQAGLDASQIDAWEINEAFSVVVLANMKLLALDPAKVNVLGGAVSLGHPIGSSGCRILVTLVHQLLPGQVGCAAICNGGGGASVVILERL